MFGTDRNLKLSFKDWLEEYFDSDPKCTMKENEQRATYEYYVYVGCTDSTYERYYENNR